ncbi:unnamed protein product [Sphagnum balticum]
MTDNINEYARQLGAIETSRLANRLMALSEVWEATIVQKKEILLRIMAVVENRPIVPPLPLESTEQGKQNLLVWESRIETDYELNELQLEILNLSQAFQQRRMALGKEFAQLSQVSPLLAIIADHSSVTNNKITIQNNMQEVERGSQMLEVAMRVAMQGEEMNRRLRDYSARLFETVKSLESTNVQAFLALKDEPKEELIIAKESWLGYKTQLEAVLKDV